MILWRPLAFASPRDFHVLTSESKNITLDIKIFTFSQIYPALTTQIYIWETISSNWQVFERKKMISIAYRSVFKTTHSIVQQLQMWRSEGNWSLTSNFHLDRKAGDLQCKSLSSPEDMSSKSSSNKCNCHMASSRPNNPVRNLLLADAMILPNSKIHLPATTTLYGMKLGPVIGKSISILCAKIGSNRK